MPLIASVVMAAEASSQVVLREAGALFPAVDPSLLLSGIERSFSEHHEFFGRGAVTGAELMAFSATTDTRSVTEFALVRVTALDIKDNAPLIPINVDARKRFVVLCVRKKYGGAEDWAVHSCLVEGEAGVRVAALKLDGSKKVTGAVLMDLLNEWGARGSLSGPELFSVDHLITFSVFGAVWKSVCGEEFKAGP